MKIIKKLVLITICYLLFVCTIFAVDNPISTDSRIKTLIYNPNEIFRIVVHYNFQTSIECISLKFNLSHIQVTLIMS